MPTIAILLAGGAGKRFGGDKPKQFLPLADGRSVLEHAVAAFRRCACIDRVMVVMHPDWLEEAKTLVPGVELVPGGQERWESSVHALRAIPEEEAHVLIHDVARPFVSERIIEEVCQALEHYPAVTVAVPATDTIYRVQGEDGAMRQVAEIPDRSTMMRAQTPQAFHLSVIREAFSLALGDPEMHVTDDCSVVHHYLPNTPICIVEGEEANRKITFQADLAL